MKTKLAVMATVVTLLAGAGTPVEARKLDLAKVPLFLAGAKKPNIVVSMDDSPSMEAGWMPEDFDARFVDSDPTPAIKNLCSWQTAPFFSSARNTVYFNPAMTYVPPLKGDGTRFPDANFNAAWVDGIAANALVGYTTTVDLGTAYFPTYELQRDPPNPVTNPPHRQIKHTETPAVVGSCGAPAYTNLKAKLPFASVDGLTSRAFYYNYIGPIPPDPDLKKGLENITNYAAVDVTAQSAQVKQNFANWYSYYRTRTLLARSVMSEAFSPREPTFRLAWQTLSIKGSPITGSTIAEDFEGTQRTNFFSWLYKFREQGWTPTRKAMLRVADFYSRSGLVATNPYYDRDTGKELSCRVNNHLLVTDGYWNDPTDPTMAPKATNHDQLSRSLPDVQGTSYLAGSDNTSKIFWNEVPATANVCNSPVNNPLVDDSEGTTNTAVCLPTLADIAFHYWSTDLRPDLTNNVPRRWKDLSTGVTSNAPPPPSGAVAVSTPEVYFNPVNNPATWQHMVNHIVAMGAAGTLKFPDAYQDLRKGTKTWPTPAHRSSKNIDDAWHAAINSRGQFYLATNVAELSQQLRQILDAINEEQGTASAASVTSGIATGDSFAIRTEYQTAGWSGSVRAYPVGLNGFGVDPLWDAGKLLDQRDPGGRQIITYEGPGGDGVPFRWASLPASWQTSLNDDPALTGISNDGQGEARLNYLRGVRDQEASKGGLFRSRVSVMGAVVYSGAAIIGAPANGYDRGHFPEGSDEVAAWDGGETYLDFVADHRSRRRVIYVGANDGMLHAFDAGVGTSAGTGQELWAYLPYEVSNKIGRLTHPAFGFEPMVDSTPAARDVFINGEWRTILVGALRRGGQGIFALDITDPEHTEASASDTVLWEFTDDSPGGARMGYSYGKANIVRLHNGKWAVMVPGGYNNEETADGALPDASVGDGTSSLFILDAETGAVVKEFNLPDSYGLAFATAGSKDDDAVDDFAVAGDLIGNLWRFDLSSEDPASWSVELMYEAETPEQFPITSAPRIFADTLTGGAIVLFGTGKLVETADTNIVPVNTPAQRIVAVRDRDTGSDSYPWKQTDLVKHTINKQLNGDLAYYKLQSTILEEEDGGWYVDLPERGERIINAPGALFSSGLAVVNSVIPSADDPCEASLGSNLFVLDASTGAAVELGAMFDTNGDEKVDANDDATAMGVSLQRGVAEGTPALIVGVGGGVAAIPEFPNVRIPEPVWRRRYWREVRDEK